MERYSGFWGGMSSDVLTAMRSGLRCSSLPTGMSHGEEIRRWEPPRGLRISVVLFCRGTKDLVEVSNITNATVEVSKFFRGPEMKYWGSNFCSSHPSVGRLSAQGNRPLEVIRPVPWVRNSIK
jgi:hypothetical protein